MKKRVLVVEDDSGVRSTFSLALARHGFEVLEAEDGTSAVKQAEQSDLNLVLLDYELPDFDGHEVLRRIKALKPNLPVVFVTGYGTISRAVDAIKLGALNFVEKPLDEERLLVTVRNAVDMDFLERENRALRAEVLEKYQMVGTSEPMQKVYGLVSKVAAKDISVLITGETGTGKELAARAIHNQSLRAAKPFIKLNCAAIPKELAESELFGHEKGAFTGAVAAKPGKVELADGGTLLLDEVGDLNLEAQAKLLRFLQEGEFERIGSTQTQKVDARVIAATNKNLLAESNQGNFREDLYYRLNVIAIEMPPLRRRRDDIPALCEYFLARFSEEDGTSRRVLTQEAASLLSEQPWPGNVRELEHTLRRITVLVEEPALTPENVLPFLQSQEFDVPEAEGYSLRQARQVFEKKYILAVLSTHHWSVADSAHSLGVERTYLYRKLKDLGISLPGD